MLPDNYDLWEKHDSEKEMQLDRLPECNFCGEPIQDEYCFEINDELFCEKCMDTHFKKETEDFIE